MLLLENDLYELEATVERLRGQAANRYGNNIRNVKVDYVLQFIVTYLL